MIITLLLLLLVFILSALPLYFAVKFLGGKTTLFKIIIINVLIGLLTILIKYVFNTWAGILSFIVMILLYKYFFRIGIIRAILAWLLQFIFAALFILLIFLIFGISLLL